MLRRFRYVKGQAPTLQAKRVAFCADIQSTVILVRRRPSTAQILVQAVALPILASRRQLQSTSVNMTPTNSVTTPNDSALRRQQSFSHCVAMQPICLEMWPICSSCLQCVRVLCSCPSGKSSSWQIRIEPTRTLCADTSGATCKLVWTLGHFLQHHLDDVRHNSVASIPYYGGVGKWRLSQGSVRAQTAHCAESNSLISRLCCR